MKWLFILPAYLVITTSLSIIEVNDRLQDHYAGRYMSEIAALMPEHLQVP